MSFPDPDPVLKSFGSDRDPDPQHRFVCFGTYEVYFNKKVIRLRTELRKKWKKGM